MSAGTSSPGGGHPRKPTSAIFLRDSHPARLPVREQVAAVCYRVTGREIELLLVQTRSGRWTFPKGGLEPGLTDAQAAALEAYEEAGVHGRIEEASFARYTGRKRGGRGSGATELAVKAHLCEVLWHGSPQESKRNPTWFPAKKAKRRLRDDRTSEDGAELVRVIERAVIRIQRLRRNASTTTDALQRVQFEAPPAGVLRRIKRVSFVTFPAASRLKLLPKSDARDESGVSSPSKDPSGEPTPC